MAKVRSWVSFVRNIPRLVFYTLLGFIIFAQVKQLMDSVIRHPERYVADKGGK